MKLYYTAIALALVAVILGLGVKVDNITGCYYGTLYISRPCSIINICIWLVIIVLAIDFFTGVIYPKIKKSLLAKKGKELVNVVNRETKEVRQFYMLSHHAECIVKNSNAEPVAKYLMQKWTETPSSVTNEQTVYMIDRFQYFDPKTHNTLQYAIVASGIKQIMGKYPTKIAGMNLYPVISANVIELFTITISQGGEGTSRVTFDTDITAMDEDYSEFVFKDLKEVFKIGRIKRH